MTGNGRQMAIRPKETSNNPVRADPSTGLYGFSAFLSHAGDAGVKGLSTTSARFMLDRLPETSPTPPANVDEESSGDECVDHRFECKLTSQTSHPSPLTLRLEKVVMHPIGPWASM